MTTPAICFSKMSVKPRLVLAVMIVVVSIAVDVLMVHFGSHPTGFVDLISFTFALLIVFRPQWLDRWGRKFEKKIEKADPDLRRSM